MGGSVFLCVIRYDRMDAQGMRANDIRPNAKTTGSAVFVGEDIILPRS